MSFFYIKRQQRQLEKERQLEAEKDGHDKAMADAKSKSDAMVDVIADFKKL